MKTGTLLLVSLAALAVFEYSQLGIAAGTVQFVFEGVQIQNLNSIIANILVQNVSNSNIQLNSMALTLTVNGSPLGSAQIFPQSPIIIASNTQQPIPVSITPDWSNIPGDIAQIIQGNLSGLDFKADGFGNVNNVVLPIHIEKQMSA